MFGNVIIFSVGFNENSIATPSILGFYWISKIGRIQIKQNSFRLFRLIPFFAKLCTFTPAKNKSLMIFLDFFSNGILVE